jgi:hypothetical protein
MHSTPATQPETPPAPKPAPAPPPSLGSVQIEIKEVDLSRPTRPVNRMWPNR